MTRHVRTPSCTAVDDEDRPVPLTAAAAQPDLTCGGGSQDEVIFLKCNADRSAIPALGSASNRQGPAPWKAGAHTGHAVWFTDTSTSSPTGQLEFRFDDPAQAFCKMRARGGSSGTDLFQRWLPTVPL